MIIRFILVFLVLLMGFFTPCRADEGYLTILSTNDLHGKLCYPNIADCKNSLNARRNAVIKRIKNTNENVLILDAGDIFSGSLFGQVFKGMPDVKIMSMTKYDAAVIGNHEFDEGVKHLQKLVSNAEFPFLCANIEFLKNKKLNKKIKKYIIKEYDDFKVGIIGLITENLEHISHKAKGVKVLSPLETAKYYINEIDEKTDIIILLTHLGYTKDVELAKSIKNADIIIGGHSHTLLEYPKVVQNSEGEEILILQNGEFGKNLSRLDIKINDDKIEEYFHHLMPISKSIKADKNIEKYICELGKEINKLNKEKIGEFKTPLDARKQRKNSYELPAGRLVNNAIKYYLDKKGIKADVYAQNTGGIRSYKKIPAGNVYKSDIYTIYPFNNKIEIYELTGKEVKQMLETGVRALPGYSHAFLQVLGIKYDLNPEGNSQFITKSGKILRKGSKISNIKINEMPIRPNKLYKIATSDYLGQGGNGFKVFKDKNPVFQSDNYIKDIVADYIKENSPLRPLHKSKILNFETCQRSTLQK